MNTITLFSLFSLLLAVPAFAAPVADPGKKEAALEAIEAGCATRFAIPVAVASVRLKEANLAFREGHYDVAKATFEELAKDGYSGAAMNLSVMYQEGAGVQRDPQQAEFWSSAAKQAALLDAVCRNSNQGGK